MGGFVLDFYCVEAKLAVELDGGGHADRAKRSSDTARTAELLRRGVRVVRFWNGDVMQNLGGVLQRIAGELRASPPSP